MMMTTREIDKLEDDTYYKVKSDMLYYSFAGEIFSGRQIKEECPLDVSPNQGWQEFFEEI